MYRVVACVVMLSSLVTSQPPATVIPPVAALATSAYPYSPTVGPFNPYNNPYYNRPGGPALPIVSYSSEHPGDGTYAFSFTTADGKQAQENGFLKDAYIDNAGEPQGTQVVQGSYAYVSPEGTPIQVSYVADENGFRPSGVHIPADGKLAVLPPVPLSNSTYDPVYNRYNNPYYNNRLNNYYNPNNPYRPFDPRVTYDPRHPLNGPRYPFSGFNPYNGYPGFGYNKEAKALPKKDA